MNAKLLLNQYNTYFLVKQRNHLYTGKILNNQDLSHVRHYNIITQLKIFLAFHVKGWHWKVKCHTLVKYGLDMYKAVSHHLASSPIWMPALWKGMHKHHERNMFPTALFIFFIFQKERMQFSSLKNYAEFRNLPHILRIEDWNVDAI